MQGNYTAPERIRKRSILQSPEFSRNVTETSQERLDADAPVLHETAEDLPADLIDAMNEVIQGDLNAPGAGMIIPLDPTGMAW